MYHQYVSYLFISSSSLYYYLVYFSYRHSMNGYIAETVVEMIKLDALTSPMDATRTRKGAAPCSFHFEPGNSIPAMVSLSAKWFQMRIQLILEFITARTQPFHTMPIHPRNLICPGYAKGYVQILGRYGRFA
jgi:hypothetical protein